MNREINSSLQKDGELGDSAADSRLIQETNISGNDIKGNCANPISSMK